MSNMEDKIRDILQNEECTFNESVKRIVDFTIKVACEVVDEMSLEEEGVHFWTKKLERRMRQWVTK